MNLYLQNPRFELTRKVGVFISDQNLIETLNSHNSDYRGHLHACSLFFYPLVEESLAFYDCFPAFAIMYTEYCTLSYLKPALEVGGSETKQPNPD